MKSIPKKSMVAVVLLAAAMMILTAMPALAGGYPDKPIHIIYPFPAGSGGDIGTRILADSLTKVLGQPVKVSNVTGGSGTIGAAKVAQARADGYEIGSLPIGPALTQPVLAGNLPYNTSDLTPICQFTYLPIVLVAPASAPYKTTKELIAYAKNNPDKVTYGHPGLGSVPYMMIKTLEEAAGIKMKGVPFKGLQPAVTAAVGEHVGLALSETAGAIGFQQAGKLNMLAIFANERMKLLPDVPTMDEDGVKEYPMLWTGIFVPKGTPPDIVKTLENAMAKATADEAFVNAMTKAKLPVHYLDSQRFAAKISVDIKHFEAYKAKRQ